MKKTIKTINEKEAIIAEYLTGKTSYRKSTAVRLLAFIYAKIYQHGDR